MDINELLIFLSIGSLGMFVKKKMKRIQDISNF